MIYFKSLRELFKLIRIINKNYYESLNSHFERLNIAIGEYNNLQEALFKTIKRQIILSELPALDSTILEQALFFNENPQRINENAPSESGFCSNVNCQHPAPVGQKWERYSEGSCSTGYSCCILKSI